MPVDVAASFSTTRGAIGALRGGWRYGAFAGACWVGRFGMLGCAGVLGAGWLLWWARALFLLRILHVRVPLPVCVGRSVGAVGDAAREGERGVVCCSVLAGLKVPAYSCQLVSRLLSVGDGAHVRGWVPVRARVASV